MTRQTGPTDPAADPAPGSLVVHSSSPILRRGLRAILADDGWTFPAEEGGPSAPLDVVVWDADSARGPLDLAEVAARHGTVPVIAIVPSRHPVDPAELLSQGVAGIVDSDIDEPSLCKAVRAVSEGRTVLHAGLRADASMRRPPSLTRRELQVLELLGDGRSNRDIADALVISENTVKNHVRRLYEKLQVRSRTEAVVLGVRWGLISLAPGA